MAGNRVTLTFAGDTEQLEGATQRAGQSTSQLGEQVEGTSGSMRNVGGASERASEGLGNVDNKSRKVRHGVQGARDIFQGLTDDSKGLVDRTRMVTMGIGDFADGVSGALIPALTKLTGFLKGGLRAALNTIAKHPIMAFVIALGTAFVTLWTKSETFRNIVKGVFNAIGTAVSATVSGIKAGWNGMVNGLKAAINGVKTAASSVWDGIKAGAKAMVNGVIWYLNNFVHAANKILDGVNLIPGVDIPHIPDIPTLHDGGRVPGAKGQEVLTKLQAGEQVKTSAQSDSGDGKGGIVMSFSGDTDSALARAIMKLMRSGDIQLKAS